MGVSFLLPRETLISRLNRKAHFFIELLPEDKNEAILFFYGKENLKRIEKLLHSAIGFRPEMHIHDKMSEEERREVMKRLREGWREFLSHTHSLLNEGIRLREQLPPFLRGKTSLLLVVLLRLSREPFPPRKGHLKTFMRGFTRYLRISVEYLKELIITNATDVAKMVNDAEHFARLISALTGENVFFTHHAARQFKDYERDERFKITAFEKIVRYLKGEERARTYYGLIDLGKSHEYVRILLKPVHGAYEIVWMSTINEHDAYEKFLRKAA